MPREGGDTVSHLPLSALVSEALVAFAMDYEEESPVALSLSTTNASLRRGGRCGRLATLWAYPHWSATVSCG